MRFFRAILGVCSAFFASVRGIFPPPLAALGRRVAKRGLILFSLLVRFQLWIAAGAALRVWQTFTDFHRPDPHTATPLAAVVVVFAFTLSVYNLHRLVTARLHAARSVSGDAPRFVAARQAAAWHTAFVVVGVVLGGVACVGLNFLQFVVLGCSALPTLLYSIPFRRRQPRRLRDIGWLKPLLIVVVWVMLTAVLPLAAMPATTTALPLPLYVYLLWRGLWLYLLCLPFDRRDRTLDAADHVHTLAATLTNAQYLALVATVGGVYTVLGAWAVGEWVSSAVSALLFLGLCAALTYAPPRRTTTDPDDLPYYGIVDGFLFVPYLIRKAVMWG